ncbi:RNA-directed DNA polymerase [Corynebacterium flavescens]|uniref:RNA-directed DNA polymerase n=1 Tax=Corynebacterium flavescens TaxID=28028 RepID=UPI003FD0A3BE
MYRLPTLPLINTEGFSEELAVEVKEALLSRQGRSLSSQRKSVGKLAPVVYYLTRFDGKRRVMELPHPGPYSNLVLTIAGNWDVISQKSSTTESVLRLRKHRQDPRLVIFSGRNGYASSSQKLGPLGITSSSTELMPVPLERRFVDGTVINLDISNFFSSIYTHALDWAISGQRTAPTSGVGPDIDRAFRMVRTMRTDGIGIGPVTSNLAGELILNSLDNLLVSMQSKDEIRFSRFVDDLTLLIPKGSDETAIINKIAAKLQEVSLYLNSGKTVVMPYRRYYLAGIGSSLTALQCRLGKISMFSNIPRFFQEVERESLDSSYSFIKYSWELLRDRFPSGSNAKTSEFVNHSLTFLLHYPHMASSISDWLVENSDSTIEALTRNSSFVEEILKQFLNSGFTDAAAWVIYLMLHFNLNVVEVIKELGFFNNQQVSVVTTWLNPVVALMLSLIPDDSVLRQLSVLFSGTDPLVDGRTEPWSSSWIIRYHLYSTGVLADDTLEESEEIVFPILRDSGFAIVRREPA